MILNIIIIENPFLPWFDQAFINKISASTFYLPVYLSHYHLKKLVFIKEMKTSFETADKIFQVESVCVFSFALS